MSFNPLAHHAARRGLPSLRCGHPFLNNSYSQPRAAAPTRIVARTFFGLFKRNKKAAPGNPSEPIPLLSEDNLFHPLSTSPFPAVRARGEAIQTLAPCPVCSSPSSPSSSSSSSSAQGQGQGHTHTHKDTHAHTNAHTNTNTKAQPKAVKFECPDCGWPTHCTEEHWEADKEHQKYCARLREANEDEHDLRSGRRMREFELPGPQGYEETVSLANWDIFWYTRNFPSMDTERARRHASKLLTYPITIGGALHQHSGMTLSNQRVTPEGSRSLAAIRSTLHVPTGAPETEEATVGKPQVRIFIPGARAESSLPPHVWEQLTFLFPSTHFHLFFIGPQVSLPKPPTADTRAKAEADAAARREYEKEQADAAAKAGQKQQQEEKQKQDSPNGSEPGIVKQDFSPEEETYLPNVYQPPTPKPIERLQRTRDSITRYGVPSYTVAYTPQLTITGMQANYADVHAQFQHTLDPYSDVFFFFSPGFGFPSPESVSDGETDGGTVAGEPLLQIASPTEWGPVMPQLLASKCPIFVTGFSPTDVERDVKSLAVAPEVAGEFEWVITPGANAFGSEKWEVADFDPRVMVKTNWGIWGIRGKSRDVQEQRSIFASILP